MAAPAGATALQASGLGKAFRAGGRVVQALNDVSFSVRSGVVTGLVGPDGAGKTTLMRLAAGLLLPDQGSIVVLGMDAAREPLRVQGTIGYMPQRFGLYEDLTVQENLDLYADLHGGPGTVHPAAGRASFRRHEAEARPRLRPGAPAAAAAAGRADRRRRPGFAARAVGHRLPFGAGARHQRALEHCLSGRGGTLR